VISPLVAALHAGFSGPTVFISKKLLRGPWLLLGNFLGMALYRARQLFRRTGGWLAVDGVSWGWSWATAADAMFIARVSRGGQSSRSRDCFVVAAIVTTFWFTIVGGTGFAFELGNTRLGLDPPLRGSPAGLSPSGDQQKKPPNFFFFGPFFFGGAFFHRVAAFLILTTIFVPRRDSMTYVIRSPCRT